LVEDYKNKKSYYLLRKAPLDKILEDIKVAYGCDEEEAKRIYNDEKRNETINQS